MKSLEATETVRLADWILRRVIGSPSEQSRLTKLGFYSCLKLSGIEWLNHCLNQGLVKCFIEDREDYEKMAMTSLHYESMEPHRAFLGPNTEETRFFRVWAEMIAWTIDFL